MEQISIQPPQCTDKSPLQPKVINLLIGSLVLGLLFNLLFFDKPLGLSYPLYIAAMYLLFLWIFKEDIQFKLKLNFTGLLGLAIMALSFSYLFFSNPIFEVLNFILIPILFVAHTLLLTSNNQFKWFELPFLLDLFYGMSARPLGNFLKPFILITVGIKDKTNLGKHSAIGKILVGLIAAILLLMLIIPLLASADDVFRYFMEQIPNLFKDLNFGQFFPRLVVVTIVSCLTFSYLWSLYSSKNQTPRAISSIRLLAPTTFLDPVTVTTLLIVINAVYLFFIGIQFSYLFGSLTDGLPQHFTYAQYARKGFFELVAVTLINLVILITNLNFIKVSGKKIIRTVKVLNTTLVICTFIMLLSAHFRMSLYEDAYGFTYLRILTHAFMGYLFVLFILTLAKIWRQSLPLLKSFILLSIFAYTLLNYVNIDRIIVKHNIERFNQGSSIDISYLTKLSYDAVPQLVDFMKETSNPGVVSQLRERLQHKRDYLERLPWQSFNLSKYQAKTTLKRS